MNVGFKRLLGAASCCAVLACGAATFAADAKVAVDRTNTAVHNFRVSQLEKMNVRNNAGDKIGSIEDLVIDARSGKIAYAALGFGGILGIGEKLFAVPWNELQVQRVDNENFILLNVTKEELKAAPGFDKNAWPDFADPNFTEKIDQFYHGRHVDANNKVGTTNVAP